MNGNETNGNGTHEARPAVNEAVRHLDGQQFNIALPNIDIETCQQRVKIDRATVDEYAEILSQGRDLKSIDIWWDGWPRDDEFKMYLCSDGSHRWHGYAQELRPTIPAILHIGTLRDAMLAAVRANHNHGLRRSNEDKRKAVLTMLNDLEWSQWSDREIARQCGVSYMTVARVREEMKKAICHKWQIATAPDATVPVDSDPPIPENSDSSIHGEQIARTVQRGGTTYTMTIPPPPLRRPVPPPPPAEYPENWDEPLLPDDPDGYAGDDGADYSDGADADQPDGGQPDQTDADQPDYAAVTRIYPAAEPSAPPRRVAPPPPRFFNGPDEGATGIGGGGGGAVPGMAGASLESPLPVASQAEPGELLEDWMRLTETVARLVPVSWLEDMAGYLAERIAARRG